MTTVHQASRWVSQMGISQRELATATDSSQTSIALQLSGNRRFTRQLEVALRGYLIGRGCSHTEVSGEVAAVRAIAQQR